MFASGGVLSEEYLHDESGVCMDNGQTEAEGVPSQGGRGDALHRRMSPYLALTARLTVNRALIELQKSILIYYNIADGDSDGLGDGG